MQAFINDADFPCCDHNGKTNYYRKLILSFVLGA